GIKGIAFDVRNYNQYQHSLAIRIAGSDNTNLTDTTKSLWQTSISNHPSKVIYNSGLVRSRNSAFIPYDDNGLFEGTMYITLDSIGFTNIGSVPGFPTKIQPVLRILPGQMNTTSYQNYDFYIENIRFVSDDSEFESEQITMNQIGGSISGNIDGKVVSNSGNNNVVKGTEVTFKVTANNGYQLASLNYTMGSDTSKSITLDENNEFKLIIIDNVFISVIFIEIDYQITY